MSAKHRRNMQVCVIAVIAATLALQDVRAIVVTSPMWMCWGGIFAAQCLVLFSALFVSHKTRSDLRLDSKHLAATQLAKRTFLHHIVWLTASLMMLMCFRWPEFVSTVSPTRLLSRPIVLLPVLIPLIGSWAIFFGIESELNPTAKQLGCFRFVLGRIRQVLLLPVFAILLVVGWQDVVAVLPTSSCSEFWLGVIRTLPLVAMMFFFPVLLRHTWRTQTLGDGDLRERLEQIGGRTGFHSRDILVWKTAQTVRNAAVAGIVPQWRYVFLSDGLLRDLSAEHVECVFLHEVGHIKSRHPLRLLLAALLLFAFGIATASIALTSPSAFAQIGAFVGLCLGIILFGRLSRLFELQADLWAAKHSQVSKIQYLRAIASTAGGDPDARTWLHPSFQQRCDFILGGLDPAGQWIRTQVRRTILSVGLLLGFYGVVAAVALYS